ncbi:MAG: ABC transporter substrate-binding protein [Rhodospirillaceae bacterium]
MLRYAVSLAVALALSSGHVHASQDGVKIGFVTTLTTPAGVLGKDMVTAAEIALAHIGGKMGGKEVDLIVEDDGFKPDIGKQKTDKLVKSDKVDFVTGFIWSHVLLASRKSALDGGKFLISANAGPSQLAGKLCHKNFFSSSWQNDQNPMNTGIVLNQAGVKKLYIMAPNYAAGKNMVAGVERTFKGEIVGKDLTKWGKDAQLDFSAELAKAKASGAEALFVFYPGPAGPALIKQYEQAGLRDQIPLYTVFTVDALSLSRLQKANLGGVLGSFNTMYWAPDLDNPANKRFVADFKKKTGRYPTHYAAQSYDAIMLIKSGVDAVNGDMSNKDGIRAAMKKADFDSVRGAYSYGSNHFPVQNFYLRQVKADADGTWFVSNVRTISENHQDTYFSKCKM